MIVEDKNIKVLVVDDDEINREMAKMILNAKLPYKVYTAHSGLKGVEIMHQVDINLVLLDITMPIWDGFKTLDIMRGEKRLSKVPVIFLTASADINTVVKANEYGIRDFIKKPFLPEDLVGRVAKVIWEQWKKPEAAKAANSNCSVQASIPAKKDKPADLSELLSPALKESIKANHFPDFFDDLYDNESSGVGFRSDFRDSFERK